MPRPSIDDLRRELRSYRLSAQVPDFETDDFVRKQDGIRAKGLRSPLIGTGGRVDLAEAARLSAALQAAADGGKAPRSLASSTHYRKLRNRTLGAVWQFADTCGVAPQATAHLVSRNLAFTPEELHDVDPRELRDNLRQDFIRAGAGRAEGALIAFLHGEFEPEEAWFQLHFHALIVGDYVDVVEGLRGTPKYRVHRQRGADGQPPIPRPIVVQKLIDRSRQLSYLLKSFWPSRRIGPVGDGGAEKRNRNGSRIPEPYHSEVLLWLDRWKLSDLTLMMGAQVRNGRICLTSPSRGGKE